MILNTIGWIAGIALQQTAASSQFDLSTVVNDSLKNSTELRIAQESLNAARARIGEQLSRGRPQVNFEGTAFRYDDKTELAFGQSSIEALKDHLENLALQISQPVDISGSIRAGIARERLNALATEFDLGTQTNARILDAKVAYYTLLRQVHAVEVAEANLTAAQNQGRVTKLQVDAGVGQPIDAYRSATQIAEAERQVTRARNARDIARSELNDRLGRPLEAPLGLKEVASTSVGTNSAGPTDAEPFVAPLSEDQKAELTKTALDQRPDLRAATVQLKATQYGIKIARSGNQPSFRIGLGGNYYPTFSFQTPRQATATLSLTLSIPIYDGGLTQARVAEAKAQSGTANARLDQVQRNVRLDVERSILEVENARRSLTAANASLKQALAARRLAQSRYENGVGLYLEITDTQAALVTAQTAQVNAVYDLLVAQAQLEYATGTPTRG
jgi:outer membrane protein